MEKVGVALRITLLFFFFCSLCLAQLPMSPCMEARSTYYNYVGQQNGACQLGPLGGPMLSGFTNVAAPNQAFFNNSMSCGECYEISGPNGNVTIIVADECPVEGNPLCAGQMIHFDLGSSSTFSNLADPSLGVILETIKKVSCPVTSNIGVYFVSGTSQYWVGFIVFSHKVGLTLVELQPTSGGAYYPMTRNSNQWEYSSPPSVSIPYNIRLTGVTGEQLIISLNTYTSGQTVSSTVQFADPSPGFGGGSPTPCSAPLPPDVIYDDYLYNGNGASSNAWSDWSFHVTNNFASTNSPYSGLYCWSSQLSGYGGIQLGRGLPIKWVGEFTSLQFAIRADAPYSDIAVFWGGVSTTYPLSITTTWQVVTLSLTTDLNSPTAGVGASPATLYLQNNAGTATPTIYIDEMVFLPRNNASYVNPAYPPGGDGSTDGSASGHRVSLFLLALIPFLCMCILL